MTHKILAVGIVMLVFIACSTQPPITDDQVKSAISASNDFDLHEKAFIVATKKLVKKGTCTLSELNEMGGWLKAQTEVYQPVYFTYCGGMKIKNRIYLNTSTGKVYK